MSKFIPKSRIKQESFNPKTWNDFTWSNKAVKEDLEQTKEIEEHYKRLEAEKVRIENVHIDELSFRDLYAFPFHQAKYGSWVYDKNDNFIFQFENVDNNTRERCLEILNEEHLSYNRVNIEAKNGEIFINGEHFITIRGWGNLTGIGAYNLNGDYATKIQDTLQEYIVNKLKK